jgi:mannose-6-phosphate isomerase-like protein (cupin superfamily)
LKRSHLIIVSLPFLTVALVLAPTLQADPPGFIMWDTSELEERNSALGTRIGPDGSARETLADYVTPSGSHRFRFIRRDSDGRPELHDNIDDVVYIQSGAGSLRVGGEMLGRTGDVGTGINGGYRYAVTAGDILRIPAGTPHAYLVPDGGHVTYVLVRNPVFVGEVVTDPDGEAPQLNPPGFGQWTPRELVRRNATLATRVGPDDSARETLADYGRGGASHRFRFIRRDADGNPELHDDIIDVVFIQSGEGTLLVGGEMIGRSNTAGSRINGGSRYPLAAGDVLHIPARTPHAYLVPDGGHITYVLVRVPAFER